MKNTHILFIVLLLFTFSGCKDTEDTQVNPDINDSIPVEVQFSVDQHNILKNDVPFQVRGVVYVPGYPGYMPWDTEVNTDLPLKLKNSITFDLYNIKEMGANTVRFWGAPQYCYEVVKSMEDFYFLQTIWIQVDAPDFQDEGFKIGTKIYIRQVIDRIYDVFPNNDPPIVAFLVGNELSEASINATDAAHPEINHYAGNYIVTDSTLTATEAFLAEMADYVKTYEFDNYGNTSLVSYSNDIRTAYILDVPFLDFRSHNAYSYAVPYYLPNTPLGSTTGTIFQGWIEDLKAMYPEKPLLITETGLSVSPNATHVGPPNYGYGGNTEAEQAEGILQNLNDIDLAPQPLAGVCIHEYLDAWWKFSLEDSYSQDPDDIEEWFGIVKLIEDGDWYTTTNRPIYDELKNIWSLQR